MLPIGGNSGDEIVRVFYSRELTCANFLANSFGTLLDHILLDRVESRRKLHLVHQLQMDMGFSDTDLPLWMKSGYEVEKEYQHPKFLNISESRHLDNVLLLSNVHLKGGNQPKASQLMLRAEYVDIATKIEVKC